MNTYMHPSSSISVLGFGPIGFDTSARQKINETRPPTAAAAAFAGTCTLFGGVSTLDFNYARTTCNNRTYACAFVRVCVLKGGVREYSTAIFQRTDYFSEKACPPRARCILYCGIATAEFVYTVIIILFNAII